MLAEVKKVQELLDLPLDNDDRFSGFDDMPTFPTNSEPVQQNLPTIKSLK